MPRAIMIDPGQDPAWIDLDPAGINAAVRALLGPADYAVIQRDADSFGPGVQLAVYEWSLNDESPHNNLASGIVAGLGHAWHVHGRAVLMGLYGPATVDLPERTWRWLLDVEAGLVHGVRQ